jgi:hypothetical protein
MLWPSFELAKLLFALAAKLFHLAPDHHARPVRFFAGLGHRPATDLSDASFDLFPDSLQVSLHFAQLLFDVADAFLYLADRLLIQTPLVNVLADFLPHPADKLSRWVPVPPDNTFSIAS